MSHTDFLTNFETALLKLLTANTVLASYTWEVWDSDKTVKRPRGVIELEATRDLEESPIFKVMVTITLEGKPKKQKMSSVAYELETVMSDNALCANLQALTSLVWYFGHMAENTDIKRRIEGDIRKVIGTCTIFAGPRV